MFFLILWKRKGDTYVQIAEHRILATSGEDAAYYWARKLGMEDWQWRDVGGNPRPEFIFRVENKE